MSVGASVMYSPSRERAFYRNLMTCNRLWDCPVCAQKITQVRREEIMAAVVSAYERGWTVIMVTYTMHHTKADPLIRLLDQLRDARGVFKGGREWGEIVAEYGWIGSIFSLEITYGEHGWHPHGHELAIVKETMTPALAAGLQKWLADRWQRVLKKQGAAASLERGIDVVIADEDIAEYIAKIGKEPEERGWHAADELARSPAKLGRKKGKTPFQLLDDYGQGDERAGQLFKEYVAAMTGRNQLNWSRGLRELLGLADEKTDAEIIDQVDDDAIEVAVLPATTWRKVVKAEKRAQLLEAAATGDRAQLAAFLAGLGIEFIKWDEAWDPPGRAGP